MINNHMNETYRTNSKRTILIVEDSELNQEILELLLCDDYNILQAENGKIGLDLLKENYRSISLILLDVIMPIMNGYEFLSIVKSESLYSSIPIIVTTSNKDVDEEVKCLDLGANDFISKPYRPSIVKKRVNNMVRLRESAQTISAIEFDEITGIYTKQAFHHYALEAIWENITTDYSILIADISTFKVLNETFGERQANKILRYLSNELITTFPNSIASRYYGDCFALLLPTNELPDVNIIQDEIIRIGENSPVSKITVKIGIYNCIDRKSTISVNCDRAILALKKIKAEYNKYISVYDNTMSKQLLQEKMILDGIDDAIEQEQFKVYFQPKHDVKTGKITGAEALIRWIHPELGFMPPNSFIPICENSGAISKLDYFVWNKTCEYLKEWSLKNISVVPISVNASRSDFLNNNYMENLEKPIINNSISPELLHLEITESIYTEKTDEIIAAIQSVRNAGIKIELDDFGSGYSSLGMLNKLPIDVIKLDMSFARNLGELEPIIDVIIQLANKLGYKTIAEGVETEEEVNKFRNLGCDIIQGYYYSKPIPKAEFEEYLINNI